MKTLWACAAAACFLLASATGRAEATIASAQQVLKEQGFYYGEATGNKDADTTAAIRRYQIRNGLKITGELNAETQKSLGVHGSVAAAPTATSTPPRTTAPRQLTAPAPDSSDSQAEPSGKPMPNTNASRQLPPYSMPPQSGVTQAPQPATASPFTAIFTGTPYETAPPAVQRQVIIRAQLRLAQLGLYREMIDGGYGAGTAAAVRSFQARSRLTPTGRFDAPTLSALTLLPQQRGMRSGSPPPPRVYRAPSVLPGSGENVYAPR